MLKIINWSRKIRINNGNIIAIGNINGDEYLYITENGYTLSGDKIDCEILCNDNPNKHFAITWENKCIVLDKCDDNEVLSTGQCVLNCYGGYKLGGFCVFPDELVEDNDKTL